MNDRDDLEQLISDRDPGMVKDLSRDVTLRHSTHGGVVPPRIGPTKARVKKLCGAVCPDGLAASGYPCEEEPHAKDVPHRVTLPEAEQRADGMPLGSSWYDTFTFEPDAPRLHVSSPGILAFRGEAPLRSVLTFNADGTIKVAEGVTADEAAAAVVEALRPRFAEMIRQERARYPLRVVTAEPATMCPLRACSEPHVHGPTGERHNAFDEGARATPAALPRPPIGVIGRVLQRRNALASTPRRTNEEQAELGYLQLMLRAAGLDVADPVAPSDAPRTAGGVSAFERLEAAIGELRAWQANDDNAAPIDDIRDVVEAFDAFTTAREPALIEGDKAEPALTLTRV